MKVSSILEQAKTIYLENVHAVKLAETTLCCSAGMIVFPTVLGIMQYFWKFTRIAAHSKLAPFCGLTSVALSSSLATSISLYTQKVLSNKESIIDQKEQMILYSCMGILTFIALRGRLRNALPSHLLNPGSFAVEKVSIPKIDTVLTKTKQYQVQLNGAKYGCHSCGKLYPPLWHSIKKLWFNKIRGQIKTVPVIYISDHIPPRALADQYASYFKNTEGSLYPQCTKCSMYQSSRVRVHVNSKQPLSWEGFFVTHATSLRLHKLWIPWPIIMQTGLISEFLIHVCTCF